ncbi:hypothetical protein QBC43DRAFT_52277 [Cladorrhinum sp. PSN259]|nr:hypothetical protein QBC43DRAFT_52277 [Cladorrhinum sp. PSN259]
MISNPILTLRLAIRMCACACVCVACARLGSLCWCARGAVARGGCNEEVGVPGSIFHLTRIVFPVLSVSKVYPIPFERKYSNLSVHFLSNSIFVASASVVGVGVPRMYIRCAQVREKPN